jgi:transposase InsO family protein
MKIYYENILANHNYIAKPNIAWVADITEFDLDQGKRIYVFFCLDVFSNRILISLFRTKPITTSDIVKKLTEVIEKRIPIKPRRDVIIHTDRGTEFSSQEYNQFIKKQEGFVVASMSRANTPKANPVAERFIRTFKEQKINGRTFQQELFYQIEINSKFKGYRKVFNLVVKSINLKPNSKSGKKSPKKYDTDASTAAMLMVEPTYSKAFSEFYGEGFCREPVDEFKMQNNNVVSILDEIAAKRAEVADKTPFDFYEEI